MHIDITDKIKELALPLAADKGLFVVDIEVKTGGGIEVWVYLDGEERGVNLDECAEISRELGFLMDAHEILATNYRLNVSSPGLSRPLTDKRQYLKNKGRKAKVKFNAGDDTFIRIEGFIDDVSETGITIVDEEGIKTSIGFDTITETKIIPVI